MYRTSRPLALGSGAGAGTPALAHGHARPIGWDALLICVATYALIAMARLHEFIPGVSVLRPGLLAGVLTLGLYMMDSLSTRKLALLKHPLASGGIFFLLWACLGAPFGLYASQSILYLVNDFSRVIVLAVVLAAAVRNLEDVRRLIMVLAIGGIVFGAFAALPAGFREVGGGGYDPNDSAMFITLTLPLTIYLLVQERRTVFKVLFAIGLLIAVIGLVRAGSRGGFLAFAAVVGYVVFFFRGVKPVFRLLTVGAVVGALTFTATTDFWTQMSSITDEADYNRTDPTGRIAIWERARGYMVANPLLGVGITNFPVAEERHPMIAESIAQGRGFKYSVAHSIWYQVGAEMGFPGLGAFIALFLISAFHLWRLARAQPGSGGGGEVAAMASALIGSLIAIAVAGTFLSNAYSGMVWGIFGLILGLFKVVRLQTAAGPATVQTGNAMVPAPAARRRNVAFAPVGPRGRR